MRYSRLDLNIIDRLISLFSQSKINKKKHADRILRQLDLIGIDTTNQHKEIIDLYINHLNSDITTNLGRRIHLILSSLSLKEGIKFARTSIQESKETLDPLFVIGLPRSGTTNIHNLLINNLGYKGFEYWQLTSPSSIYQNTTLDHLYRKTRSLLGFYLYRYFVPSIQKMHKVKMSTYEECWHFQKTMFLCYNYVIQLNFFKFEDFLLNIDTSIIHRQYKRLIQNNSKLNEIYALKCPDHMMSLSAIHQVFPDSDIVWIHRDPYDSLISYCSMVNSVWELFFGITDKKEVGMFVLELFDRMLKNTIDYRSQKNNSIVDVNYNELINNRQKVIGELSKKLNMDIFASGNNIETQFFKNKHNNKYDYGISRQEVSDKLYYYKEEFSNYLK